MSLDIFYIRDYNLLFFESFALEPMFFGWDIKDFCQLLPWCKSIMLFRLL